MPNKMDDRNFDDFVKGRLEGYEDPSFDPAALESFHEKLAGVRTMRWYEKSLSQYWLAASLLLFTSVNAYLFWPAGGAPGDAAPASVSSRTLDSLTGVIQQLRAEAAAVDAQQMIPAGVTQSNLTPAAVSPNQANGIYLGMISEVPSDVYHLLLVRQMVVTDHGYAYLVSPPHETPTYAAMLPLRAVGENYAWMQPVTLTLPAVKEQSAPKQWNKAVVSARQRTLIEKHYTRGIGIYVAPRVDLAQSIFSSGEGSITPRVGAVADWVFSPTVSVETGFDYSAPAVSFDPPFQNYSLPPSDPNLGSLEHVQLRNSLLSVPVAFKYRNWISEKGQGFVKLGYTPYFSIAQEYQYRYDFDRFGYSPVGPGPAPDPDNDHHHVNSIQRTTDHYYYGGTGSVSLGITRLIKNYNKLEASLFYERSLGNMGREQLGMQLVGIRTAYWFNLR